MRTSRRARDFGKFAGRRGLREGGLGGVAIAGVDDRKTERPGKFELLNLERERESGISRDGEGEDRRMSGEVRLEEGDF